MSPVQLTIKEHGSELVRRGLEDLSAEIPKISRLRIYEMMMRVRTRLHEPVSRPSYPINWDSEKQRRAFFATKGFGRGIPTRRTGRYQRGWNIVRVAQGYRLENSEYYARHVGGYHDGSGQSAIHRSRYPLFQEVVEEEIEGLPEEIEQAISYYGRGLGF